LPPVLAVSIVVPLLPIKPRWALIAVLLVHLTASITAIIVVIDDGRRFLTILLNPGIALATIRLVKAAWEALNSLARR
jgi:hypothetical protein